MSYRPEQAALGAVARLRVLAVAVPLALAMAAAGCAPPEAQPSASPTGAETAELALIGVRDFSFDDLARDLEDLGYDVAADGAVAATTDLLVVVVNGLDGPMPQTREAVAALDGAVIPRVAIAITDVDEQTDDEIELLIAQETIELLTGYGIAPVDDENVIRWPGPDVGSTVERHLRRDLRDYTVTAPTTPPVPSESEVGHLAGVPMSDALEILAGQGLVGEVLADPDFGVVSECDPRVMEQAPAAGTVLPAGGVVGILVSPPDAVDPAMAGCLLPELTRAQIDARVAELDAQPTR